MTDILDEVYSWLTFLPRITTTNIFEIIIISFLLYEVLVWIKNTRAWTLLKGILVILVFSFVAVVFRLDTILWILKTIAVPAVTAVIVIFQPELRKALEQLGSRNLFSGIFAFDDGKHSLDFTDRTIHEMVKAVFELSKTKTGALIVIERTVSLRETERTGIEIGGVVSSQLLINIFEHNTPLHDGAVVVRGNRIAAATCYLPLSDNMSISKDLGTRHRAALGISEVTDSVTIIVSEETGRITIAEGGVLQTIQEADDLRNSLNRVKQNEAVSSRFSIWKGRRKNERKAVK